MKDRPILFSAPMKEDDVIERRANCPMCGAPCMIEGKVGSTQYYVPIAFTREEIEMIRLLLRGIDKQVGRYSLSHIVVTKLINKCDAILKGAAE